MSFIRIYNTLTREKETLEPVTPGKIGIRAALHNYEPQETAGRCEVNSLPRTGHNSAKIRVRARPKGDMREGYWLL